MRGRKAIKGIKGFPTTHGKSNTKLYNVYHSMRQRCEDSKHSAYKLYGARGIKVCPEWSKFEGFYDWAMSNGYSEDLTIDRIDNDGDYEPSNCRWVSIKIQCNNRRSNHLLTFNGESKTLSEWSEITGISYGAIKRRINTYKWSVEDALTIPAKVGNNQLLRKR